MYIIDLSRSYAIMNAPFCAGHITCQVKDSPVVYNTYSPPPCLFQYYFTVSFTHENQKALELRTEDVKDCDEWVAAISHAR